MVLTCQSHVLLLSDGWRYLGGQNFELALTEHSRSLNPTHTCVLSCWVVANSLRHYGLWPARFFCPWDPLGKNTGIGCYSFLQGIFSTHVSCIACFVGRFFSTEPKFCNPMQMTHHCRTSGGHFSASPWVLGKGLCLPDLNQTLIVSSLLEMEDISYRGGVGWMWSTDYRGEGESFVSSDPWLCWF